MNKIFVGMKYMLATQGENPRATKHKIGKKIANILPMGWRAANALQTTRQTNKLQPIPLQSASL